MRDVPSRLIQPHAAIELQSLENDSISSIDTNDNDDKSARGGNGNDPIIDGLCEQLLHTPNRSVRNATRSRNQASRRAACTVHEPRRTMMPLSPGAAQEPEPYTQRRLPKRVKSQTCANGGDIILLTSACIAPTCRVISSQERSAKFRANKNAYFMTSPSDWSTGQKNSVDTVV